MIRPPASATVCSGVELGVWPVVAACFWTMILTTPSWMAWRALSTAAVVVAAAAATAVPAWSTACAAAGGWPGWSGSASDVVASMIAASAASVFRERFEMAPVMHPVSEGAPFTSMARIAQSLNARSD